LLRGIYSSATAMALQMNKVMMHSSNLSNSETYGYKKRSLVSKPFKELMINIISDRGRKTSDGSVVGGNFVNSLKVPVGTGSGMDFLSVDRSQGSLRPTDNPLDFAIDGDGWFVIAKKTDGNGLKPSSDIYYTKSGKFITNVDGNIITPNGDFLLDVNNNPINIPFTGGTALDLGAQGVVGSGSLSERLVLKTNGAIFDSGKETAKVQIRRSNPQYDQYIKELNLMMPGTEAVANNNMAALDGTPIYVRQGFIEQSNIKIVEEMVGLIESQNNYESAHKLIMTEDKVLDKAINELGRTG